jgi:hypothetical protein
MSASLDYGTGIAGFLNAFSTLKNGINDGNGAEIANGVFSLSGSATGFLATYAAPVGESSALPIYGLASTVVAEATAFSVAMGDGSLRQAADAIAVMEISILGAGFGALGGAAVSKNPIATLLGASYGEPAFSALVAATDALGLTSIKSSFSDTIYPLLFQIKYKNDFSANPYTVGGTTTGYLGANTGFGTPSEMQAGPACTTAPPTARMAGRMRRARALVQAR